MSDDEEEISLNEDVNEQIEDGAEEEEVTDLSNSDVCTKYQEAAKVVNLALTGLVSQCVVGAKIIDLCQFGTALIDAQTSKLYNKKVNGVTVEKGVAFPVCISVNEVVCNYSPLASEETATLSIGDVVKIDLGCHIDGYIAVAAHTVVVGESADSVPQSVDAELGNVAVAAYNAMLVAAATIKAGAKNSDVTSAVERVAMNYGVNPIATVRMHQMKRYVIDGVKEIALKEPTPDDLQAGDEKVPECEFEQAEVYAVDVALTTGDGKVRPSDLRTTVFKRNVEVNYRLKMKASRYVLSEIDKKYPTLPFTLRHFEDEKQARMGVTECVAHGLLSPYPALHGTTESKTAHFKCTVLLLPSGTTQITGLPLPAYFTTDQIPDETTAKVLADLEAAAAKKAKKKLAKKSRK